MTSRLTSRLLSSCSIRRGRLSPVVLGLAVVVLLLTACPERHIGRSCHPGPVSLTDPKVVTVNPQALECPSRFCVLPDKAKSTDTGPLCTDECRSDDDCLDAETSAAPGDPRCDSRFVCRTISSRGALACKPICVCLDFLLSDDVATVPVGCRT